MRFLTVAFTLSMWGVLITSVAAAVRHERHRAAQRRRRRLTRFNGDARSLAVIADITAGKGGRSCT